MNWTIFFSLWAGAGLAVMALLAWQWWTARSFSSVDWVRFFAGAHAREAEGWERAAKQARLTDRQEIAAAYETLAEDCRMLARDLELVAKFKEREERP